MTDFFLNHIRFDNAASPALQDDERRMTYAELNSTCRQIGSQIHTTWGADNYIVVRAAPTAPFVATLLAVMASGNTPIPVDPNLPADVLAYIKDKSRAVCVLDPPEPSQYAGQPACDFRVSSMPGLIMFTSGTSGFPKGVTITHHNLVFACRAVANYLNYHEHRSAAVVLPMHYSYALLSQVCCQLYVGGFVRLFSSFRNPLKIAEESTRLNLQTFCGVPSTFVALDMLHRMDRLSFPTVRVVCSAGAPMDHSRYARIKEVFPHSKLFNNYGMTEAAPRIAYIAEDDPRFLENTCGRPMQGVEVKILDHQTHRELPDGEVGVLAVRGPNITPGYLNDPELTQAAFTTDGFLISGDVACLREGYITILGRNDDIFNVAGEKIAPPEIERALNELPFVTGSAVRGISDSDRGSVPVAFLMLDGTARDVTRRLLHKALSKRLSPAKMPHRFYEVRSFPTTSNGKLLRRCLEVDDRERIVREIV